MKSPYGSTIGIFGRTGSGKSALMLAISNLIQLEEGEFRMGNKSTFKIGVHALRRKVAVLSQNAFIPTTSFRKLLDPFSEFTVEDIKQALSQVGLLDKYESLQSAKTKVSPGILFASNNRNRNV